MTDRPAPAHRPRRGLRLLSIGAAVLIAAAALVAAVAVNGAVRGDQHRLLRQKSDEAVAVLTATLSPIGAQLATLDAAAAGGTATEAFHNGAATLAGSAGAVALLRVDGSAVHVADLVPASTGFRGGITSTVPPTVVAGVQAALAAKTAGGGAVSLPLVPTAGGNILGFVYANAATPHFAIYVGDLVPTQYTPLLPGTLGQAFGDIDAAVYVSAQPRRDQLLISTVPLRALPLAGTVVRQEVPVLGRSWLVTIRARGSLVSGAASSMPWVLGIGGVAGALLVGAVVEALLRRREYAMRLVADRTVELRQSLDELASAQLTIVRQERLAAIGQLASAVGHELRNPLAVISNALFLLRSSNDPAVREKNISIADREVTAASLIVSDLLDFARSRAPIPTEVDLGELIGEVVSVAPTPNGVTLRRSDPAPPVRVSADRDQLRQVLLNLLTNAYEAVGEQGSVGIEVVRTNGVVQVAVTDSGAGIAPEAAGRLFEPFFTTKARGVGLGLAVSQRIAEAHGGRIEATNAAAGGAVFTVTLPLLVVPRPATEDVPAGAMGAS